MGTFEEMTLQISRLPRHSHADCTPMYTCVLVHLFRIVMKPTLAFTVWVSHAYSGHSQAKHMHTLAQ